MQIIRGPICSAIKCIIYGPEGIGKSTFASQFPNPVFIDTEGSTKFMDVARTPTPLNWTMLIEQVKFIRDHPGTCGTLVVDTADWAEQMCIESVCAKYQKTGIEDFGYGKGYIYEQEEFGRLLNLLEEVVRNGTYVLLNAHAKMRKFEQPDEMGAYDRWELKLQKGVAPMVKEWADIVLFANYKTYVVNVDNQGVQKGKNKVQGGKRVMYAAHHPCWDAKNRHGLPEEMSFEFAQIAHLFSINQATTEQPSSAPDMGIPISKEPAPETPKPAPAQKKTEPEPKKEPISKTKEGEESRFYEINGQPTSPEIWEGIPRGLCELMREAKILPSEVQDVVTKRGYFPTGTPISSYPIDFVQGVLIGAWPQVRAQIEADPDRLPF